MLFEVQVFKINETVPIQTWTCSYEYLGAYIQQGAALAIQLKCPVEVKPVLIPRSFKFIPKENEQIIGI